MLTRVAVALVVSCLMGGCSSKGDTGPAGPSGPSGPKGDTGTGAPGISVLSAPLVVGSSDCPTGGSQFTSASGTTFACNGDQGPQGAQGQKGDQGIQGPAGPPGRQLLVRTASGALIGPLINAEDGGRTMLRLAVYVESLGRVMQYLDQASGRSENPGVYFTTTDCTGTPWSPHSGRGSTIIVSGDRLFASTSSVVGSFDQKAQLDGGVCNPSAAGVIPGVPLQEVFDSRYPYAAPLQIVYE